MSVINSNNLVLTGLDAGINENNGLIGYHTRATFGNVTATSEDALYPVSNVTNPATNQLWKSGITTDQYITVNLVPTGVDEVDYMGLAEHNFGTDGATLTVEGNNGSGWTELIGDTIVANDDPILFQFNPVGLTQIRLRIRPVSLIPQLSVMYVGRLLYLQRRIYVGHTPITYARRTDTRTGRARRGKYLGSLVVGQWRANSVSLRNLTPTWYRTYMEPFVRDARASPFFYAWRPGTYPLEVGYCWFTDDPIPTNDLPNGMMAISFPLEGIVTS